NAAGGVVANATTFAAAQGVATTLSVTDANGTISNDTIYLFKVSDTEIQGRVDLDGNGTFNDANNIALRITLDLSTPSDPTVKVEQIYAIAHPTTNADESLTLGIAAEPVAGAGLGVTKTSTLTDGDNDTATDSVTANITAAIKIEDDGPQLDINTSGNTLALNLDESIVLPTT